ncbi:hypothetical protein, partial [Pseudoalteromonas luteoviolacea]
FGAGDSSDTRPPGFESFPTNNRNPETGGFIHYGVLYIERDPFVGYFQDYLRVCIKSNRRTVIGGQSMDDRSGGDKYVLEGRYKPSQPRAGDYNQLKLKLSYEYIPTIQKMHLFKVPDGKYEFEGYLKQHGKVASLLRAYYKGAEAYSIEGCEYNFGSTY